MPRRRETTGFGLRIDDSVRRVHLTQVGGASKTPSDKYEALMSCAPHEEPELSLEELAPLREWLQDAIDELPPKLRWVFDAYYVRRLSLRELAQEIGRSKTQVARLRDEATTELRMLLEGFDGHVGRGRGARVTEDRTTRGQLEDERIHGPRADARRVAEPDARDVRDAA